MSRQTTPLAHRQEPTGYEGYLPERLARAAEAVGRLIDQGLITRGVTASLLDEAGDPPPEAVQLARAYEAALLVNFSPSEVQTLRRLLARVEAAARRLAVRPS
ncbi:MAG: hypothetical protein WCI21_00280 [Alphaproteobacteria bacterium]